MKERDCYPCMKKADYCKFNKPHKSHCDCEEEPKPCYDAPKPCDEETAPRKYCDTMASRPCYDMYDRPKYDKYDKYDKCDKCDKYDRPEYNPPESDPYCDGAMPGGWTSFRQVTAADEEVFYRAIKNLMGVIYRPLYVSTQVVAGMNYLFVAQAKVISAQNCYIDIVTVSVFKALDGTITLGTIKSVRPE